MGLRVDVGPLWAFGPLGRAGGPVCSACIGGSVGAGLRVAPARESELRGCTRVGVGVEGWGEDGKSVSVCHLQSHQEQDKVFCVLQLCLGSGFCVCVLSHGRTNSCDVVLDVCTSKQCQ